MNNEELITQYREQLLKVHRATIILISVVEIAAYFLFVMMGMQLLSFRSVYLWVGVLIPICINVFAHLFAMWVCKKPNTNYQFKNNSVIYAAIVTSLVVSLFHRDYLVTSCAFVFPIILSAMYNDQKILRQSFWFSFVLLTVTILALFVEHKLNLTMWLNVVVLYGFLAVSFLSGEISIKFSQRNFALIEQQAITNSRLEAEMELDQMTQLYNHRTFYKKLELILSDDREEIPECCLAIIDIDDFKKVNDTYGHNAGDVILISLAGILKSCCQEGDYACRYGGEEFALILCGKTLTEAETIVDNVLNCFSKTYFPFTKKSHTFSCGIAKVADHETAESLFKRADQHLYTSKNNGKNQITTDAIAVNFQTA